jgi:Ni2+-binding GTPase involved in maturation of urease and hydrogenase
MDLAAAAEFDLPTVQRNIQMVRPGIRVLEVSSKTGQGMDATVSLLQEARASAFHPTT